MPADTISRFKGLNNTSDPLRVGLGWLARADNVDVTDTGGLSKRAGYTRTLAGTLTGAFSTFDYARMYFVDGGALKAMAPTPITLKTGLNAAPMYFTEINDDVYYNNGIDTGVIAPDNQVTAWAWEIPTVPTVAAVTGSLTPGLYQVRCTYTLPDGRRTGASDSAEITLVAGQALQISAIPQRTGYDTRVWIAPANSTVYQDAGVRTSAFVWNSSPDNLGRDGVDLFTNPIPLGCEVIQAWRGRIFAAQYFPQLDQSAVWSSRPLGFHLFDFDEDVFLVPGHVLMLAPHDDALIVGTDKAIHAYDGERIKTLAPYGVTPGWHWSRDDADESGQRVLFWTTHGVCAALPFKNLTEQSVSVAPGVSAGGAVVRHGGQRRYVAAIKQGGSAFNQR